MKREITFWICCIMYLFISWCGIDYSLSENSIEFSTSEFVNPVDEEDAYLSIEYEWRIYVPYGSSRIKEKDIDKCIWYIVQDWVKIDDTIVCLLSEDIENNYLVEIDTVGFMSQPIFLRAIDTVWKDIFIPKYIESLDYEFWK
jgi:hypothetical protein